MIIFHLRKCQKVHLAESAWSSSFGGENNIQSRKATCSLATTHHKTTDPLKAYFLYLQRSAVQEDQDIPRTGALTTSSPSQCQWRSGWPCIRQQWAGTRATVPPLLWWDDAATWFWWEMSFKAGRWPFGKCLDSKYGINSVVLPVFMISFLPSDSFHSLVLSSLYFVVQENRGSSISAMRPFPLHNKSQELWASTQVENRNLLIGNT